MSPINIPTNNPVGPIKSRVDKIEDTLRRKQDAAEKAAGEAEKAREEQMRRQRQTERNQRISTRNQSSSTDFSKDSLADRVEMAREKRMQRMRREGYISFSNFISEAEKELPKCPEGYKYNRDTMRCEPKKDSDDVRGKMNKSGGSSTGFTGKVIGSHGQNGAPPAYGEKSSGKGLYMSRDGDMGTSGWHDQFSGGLGSNPMGTA